MLLIYHSTLKIKVNTCYCEQYYMYIHTLNTNIYINLITRYI